MDIYSYHEGEEISESVEYGFPTKINFCGVKAPLLATLPPSLIERLFGKGIKRGKAPLRISLPSPAKNTSPYHGERDKE